LARQGRLELDENRREHVQWHMHALELIGERIVGFSNHGLPLPCLLAITLRQTGGSSPRTQRKLNAALGSATGPVPRKVK